MIEDLLDEAELKMEHTIDHLRKELGKLRTGSASLALLEGLKVDYYGNATPLDQVGTLGLQDNQTIVIQPWEAAMLKEIEKAIQSSDLGLNPSNDGKMIRLVIPPLTGERRQQLVKVLKKASEDDKIAIRNIRRDFNEKIKGLEKKSYSKDDCKKGQEKLQKLTDSQITEVDILVQAKEKDILEN
tara:strand:- start:1162 stop:1716 length:555 start_codon:yes stop_codon:yes gene_type:complete